MLVDRLSYDRSEFIKLVVRAAWLRTRQLELLGLGR
jgi:hypothetical protein